MSNSNGYDDEEVMDIDDPRVPEVVREHGLGFRKPAHYVVDLATTNICWRRRMAKRSTLFI